MTDVTRVLQRLEGITGLSRNDLQNLVIFDWSPVKTCLSPYELDMEFAVVVEGDGDTNDKSIWQLQISVRVSDAPKLYCHSPLSKT